MDLTAFTDAAADVAAAAPTLAAGVISVTVAFLGVGIALRWIRRAGSQAR